MSGQGLSFAAFAEAVSAFQARHLTPGEQYLGEAVCFFAGASALPVATDESRALRSALMGLLLADEELTWLHLHAAGAFLDGALRDRPTAYAYLATVRKVLPHVFDGTLPDEMASFPTAEVRPLFGDDAAPASPTSSASTLTH